jgi:uncharacterized surface anchored protein
MKIIKKNTMKKIASLIVILFATSILFATNDNKQSDNSNKMNLASVSGKVIDIETGESLAGACITITETGTKIYTDLDGNFSINDLNPGKYTINVSLVSYSTKESINVDLNAGNNLDKNIILNPSF